MFGLSPQVLILASCMALSAISGWRVTSWYYQAEIAQNALKGARIASEAQSLNRKLELMALDLSGAISERDAARHIKVRTVERVVNRDIIKLVKDPNVKHCDLDPQWVRIHDSAASSGMPEDTDTAPAITDPTPGVDDVTALQVITTNYAICQDIRQQLISLQEWASSIKGLQ